MQHQIPPESEHREQEERAARAYEAAGACCLLALLALLANAEDVCRWLAHLTRLRLGLSQLAVAVVGASWMLTVIGCARRSLALRLGASHFQKQREFEAEVEWAEEFLGIEKPELARASTCAVERRPRDGEAAEADA